MIDTLWAFVQKVVHDNQIFSGAVLGGVALGLLHQLRSIPTILWDFLISRFTVDISMHSSDDMYEALQEWLNNIRFDSLRRSYRIVSMWDSRSNGRLFSGRSTMPEPVYAPDRGWYLCWIHGKFCWVYCGRPNPEDEKNVGGYTYKVNEYLYIRYWGRNRAFADRILAEVAETYRKRHIVDTGVFLPSDNGWSFHSKLRPRNEMSVVLDGPMLQDIIDDISSFLDSDAQYEQLGVPYKRNYMLAGPAGTGKSSLIHYLAAYFHRDIYYLDPQDTSGSTKILNMIGSIPPSSFVLMEDFDCLFRAVTDSNNGTERTPGLSTLLNVLDGVASKRGVITFVTTNYPDRIDPTLVRRGRIDRRFDLGLCSTDQLRRLFLRFFPDEPQLAVEFGASVPPNTVPPASVQEWLLAHRSDPRAAAACSLEQLGHGHEQTPESDGSNSDHLSQPEGYHLRRLA